MRSYTDPDNGQYYPQVYANFDVSYTYDQVGRQATVTYPGPQTWPAPPVTYTYTYDSMGRPSYLTDNTAPYSQTGLNIVWVQNVQYDFAGRLTSWQRYNGTYDDYYYNPVDTSVKEARQYNANGQMSSLTWSSNSATGQNTWSTPAGIQYVYSSTQNNGQITQAVDTLSGETIAYQYDALKRLTSSSSTPNTGSSTTPWTQTFQYDGFGNLDQKVLTVGSGSPVTTSIPVTAATNRLTNASYDANGNMTSGGGATMAYDEANRIAAASETSGGTEYYGYAPDNKRIYRMAANGTEQWTFYGAQGEKLGVYTISSGYWTVTYQNYQPTYWFGVGCAQGNVWFAGKMIWESAPYGQSGGPVYQDRLGTNRASGARFYPYGEEITSTTSDRTKFATYNRDSYTGFDYADQRFYASSLGRFNTVDPYSGSARPRSPRSWNRYSYTFGDPINHSDPSGRDGGDGCDEGSWMTDTGYCEPDFGDTDQNDNSASGVVYESTGTLDSATTTAQACTNGLSYSNVTPSGNGFTGTCDNPLSSTGAAILQLTGQNLQGFDGLAGAFLGGSTVAGGFLAAAAGGEALSSLAAAIAQPVPVIGNLADTLPLAANQTYNVLPQLGWTFAGNQAWISSIVASGQSVALATSLTSAATFNNGQFNAGFTMYGVELGWLFNAGYEVVGSYAVPPVP